MFRNLFVLISFLMCIASVLSQRFNDAVEAKINLESYGELLKCSTSAVNKTTLNRSLRYELSAIVTDSVSGEKIREVLEGRFVLEPYGNKNLSSIDLETNNRNRTIVLLLIYEEDELIGKDRKVINGMEGEEDQKPLFVKEMQGGDVAQSGEDGVFLRGLVVQDTKTKAGRDFYDLFYSAYIANNINGEKIIEIKETLAIGNNTRIEIRAAEDVVMQFIVNPRQDYLERMSKHSVTMVNIYFQKLAKNKNQIIRY